MNTYILIYLGLTILSLGIVLARHGQKRTENYNFFISLFSAIVELLLLYKAGLFNNL
jgi:hypothetical protein